MFKPGLLTGTKNLSLLEAFTMGNIDLTQYLPFVLFVILALLWIVLAYKLGDWRNWKVYYPTILFFWCGDLIYNVIFHKKPLWIFTNPILSHTMTDFLCAALIFTSTVLIFIPRYPKGLINQAKYLGIWIFVYSAVEWAFVLMKGISYANGWNLAFSIIHNTYQFVLLRIHHTNPMLAWLLALIVLMIMVNIFNIPLVYD